MSERVLVTGGAGFIGSHLARRLLERGDSVTVFDNFSTGKIENLVDVATHVEIVEADVRDLDAVRRAVAGSRYVFHQAALGSVPRSVSNPLETFDINATGTMNVLVAARDAGVERLNFASSSSIYGNEAEMPKRETAVSKPVSPYALAKHAAEQACSIFTRIYGLETVALRYFNVFGPHQNAKGRYAAVIPCFITAMLDGVRPLIHGDGLQSRDFTFIDNVVDANMLALTGEPGVYNASCGGRTTLIELVDKINCILGTSLEPEFTDVRPGDIKHSQASIELARERLGYEPRVGFAEGLERTVAWFEAAGSGRTPVAQAPLWMPTLQSKR